jgi:hypothetical protein
MLSSRQLMKNSMSKLKAENRIIYTTPQQREADIDDMRKITRNMEDAEGEYRKRVRISEHYAAQTLLSS